MDHTSGSTRTKCVRRKISSTSLQGVGRHNNLSGKASEQKEENRKDHERLKNQWNRNSEVKERDGVEICI